MYKRKITADFCVLYCAAAPLVLFFIDDIILVSFPFCWPPPPDGSHYALYPSALTIIAYKDSCLPSILYIIVVSLLSYEFHPSTT